MIVFLDLFHIERHETIFTSPAALALHALGATQRSWLLGLVVGRGKKKRKGWGNEGFALRLREMKEPFWKPLSCTYNFQMEGGFTKEICQMKTPPLHKTHATIWVGGPFQKRCKIKLVGNKTYSFNLRHAFSSEAIIAFSGKCCWLSKKEEAGKWFVVCFMMCYWGLCWKA